MKDEEDGSGKNQPAYKGHTNSMQKTEQSNHNKEHQKKQENKVREKCKKERMTRTQSERKWHERKGESKKKNIQGRRNLKERCKKKTVIENNRT